MSRPRGKAEESHCRRRRLSHSLAGRSETTNQPKLPYFCSMDRSMASHSSAVFNGKACLLVDSLNVEGF